MKKAMTPLWVGIVILGALLISATMQNNISSAISLSQQNTGQTTSLYFNINTATVDELASIPGLGEDLAKKINHIF